jgi:hypothetical protein
MHYKRKKSKQLVKNVRSNLRWLGNSARRMTKKDKQQLYEAKEGLYEVSMQSVRCSFSRGI